MAVAVALKSKSAHLWLWMVILVLSNVLTGCLFTYYYTEKDTYYHYIVKSRMFNHLYSDPHTVKEYINLPLRGFLPPVSAECSCDNPPAAADSSMGPKVYVITPTMTRSTQKVMLTVFCQALAVSHNTVVWIVVEDAFEKSQVVQNLLSNCPVQTIHLAAATPLEGEGLWGVVQWNAGLKWLRKHTNDYNGVVYFGSEDSYINVKIFNELKKTKRAAVWPVAVKQRADVIEPLKSLPCKSAIIPRQPPQLHISGIATSLHLVVQHPNVELDITSDVDSIAHKYLTQLLVDDGSEQPEVECLGVPNEVLIWMYTIKY